MSFDGNGHFSEMAAETAPIGQQLAAMHQNMPGARAQAEAIQNGPSVRRRELRRAILKLREEERRRRQELLPWDLVAAAVTFFLGLGLTAAIVGNLRDKEDSHGRGHRR